MNEVKLSLPDNFQNVVRLFPLPNLVLFPGVIQALHLFEPRYRQLMDDALSSDELISMALVQPGCDLKKSNPPQLFPTICIGKIVTHARLEDGRFNLLLMGIRRAKIVREIEQGTLYRMAEIEVQSDVSICSPTDCRRLQRKVVQQFRGLCSRRPQLDEESLDQLLDSNLPLGQLLDLIAYSSGADPLQQQAVLDELNISRRAEIVLALLERQRDAESETTTNLSAEFPPGFSLN